MSNLVKRSISAIVLAPLVMFVTYKGGLLFFAMIALLFLLMFYEWITLTKRFRHGLLWAIFGFLYLGFSCFVMLFLERMRFDFIGFKAVPILLFTVVLLVWVNDIFSYIVGRIIGGPKLWPKISPNKTWAGTIGGIAACIGFFFIVNYLIDFNTRKIPEKTFLIALSMHVIIPIIAVCGDLFESWIKRKAGVKDSGNMIPGHGGILDRVDGLIMAMNIVGLTMYILFVIKASQLAAQGISV